VSLLLL